MRVKQLEESHLSKIERVQEVEAELARLESHMFSTTQLLTELSNELYVQPKIESEWMPLKEVRVGEISTNSVFTFLFISTLILLDTREIQQGCYQISTQPAQTSPTMQLGEAQDMWMLRVGVLDYTSDTPRHHPNQVQEHWS